MTDYEDDNFDDEDVDGNGDEEESVDKVEVAADDPLKPRFDAFFNEFVEDARRMFGVGEEEARQRRLNEHLRKLRGEI